VPHSYVNSNYKADSRSKPRWGVAKVEWHPGELYLRRIYFQQRGAIG
jgi:hypothetical protein